MGKLLKALAALSVVVTMGTVQAAPITFNFEAVVTQAVGGPSWVLGDGSVAVGTPIYGSYTFDSATPISAGCCNTYFGAYLINNGTDLFVAKVGNYTMTGKTWVMEILNNYPDPGNPPYDHYIVESAAATPGTTTFSKDGNVVSDRAIFSLSANPVDYSQLAFSSTDLPLTPPQISDFPGGFYFGANIVEGFSNRNGSFQSKLISLTLAHSAPVPEPATVPLVTLALLGASAAGRRKPAAPTA